MNLPNDISRCSNETCEKRKDCARFIQYINDLLINKEIYISRFDDKNCKFFIKYPKNDD